jgi:sugar lactone lactonase YvrE
MKISLTGAALLCAAASLYAVETKTWQQGEMSDFEKGTLTRLSLSSDGRMTLAPAMKEIFDPSVTFLWAVARDSKGNLYAGGGGLGGTKAKLVAVDPSGKTRTVAELEGMAIQALAIDRQDRVYAATSPDGKVYRIDAAGKADVFYDPKAKYIWALAFSKSGDLFVATGDQGEIYRVTPSGAGSAFFKTEETHARSLAIDSNDNLIVGTDPSGLILRISPAGQGFVLYQAPKREITAVAVAPDGTIYAAGVGNKQAPAPPPAPAPAPTAAPPAGGGNVTLQVGNRPAGTPPPTVTAANAITGGSEIYKIQTDGYPRRVWSHSQDVVYTLAFDARGRALAGTGNRGAIYRIDSDHSYTRLLSVAPTQVTNFCTASDGRIFVVTGNIGKIVSFGPEMESSGVFESDVLDASAFSYWGRLSTEGKDGGSIAFETRSGNLNRPQKNWSEWAKLSNGRVASPSARFLQYRAKVNGPAELSEVDVAYLMKNVPPVVEELEATPANYKFPAPAGVSAALTPSLTLPPLGRNRPPAPAASSDSGSSPTLTWSKGHIGARWLANDDNGDTLIFKLEIRGVNESTWKLLKDKIREHYYSWDSTAFPDGKYVVRITASDAPSNPPDQALTASLESDPFLIDNTAPEITGLQGSPSGSKIEIRFHAKDALSNIGKAEYSVNGGEWCVVEPTTRLTDSQEEDYRVQVERAPGETTIAVRVGDEYENQAVAKINLK